MPDDPGLAGDTCIFLEAIAGDAGIQNPNDVWWLSPDITLTGHSSGLENADPGGNRIDIRVNRRPAGCTFPGDESVTIEVWVGNPSLLMSPAVRGSTVRIAFIGSPLPPEGGTHVQHLDWTIPAVTALPLGLENPQKPGPKCLVAICYPDSLTPSSARFFVPGDQHVAQHNLSIVQTAGAEVRFKVNTFNPAGAAPLPQTVRLRAVMDLAPAKFVKKMVLTRLEPLPAFQRLRTDPLPQGFGFDLTGLQATDLVDHSHPAVTNFPVTPVPSFEANIPMGANLTQLTFVAGLKGLQAGEAAVFHLTQTSKTVAQGGLTLVILKT